MDQTLTDKLQKWEALVKKIAAECKPLIAEEQELRKEIFGEVFSAPAEGVNNYPLAAGYVLKATYPLKREVDQAIYTQLCSMRLCDLSPDMLGRLNMSPDHPEFQGNQLVADALKLNLGELVEYKPSLKLKPYRELTAEQALLFDRCLDIKPGSISMEITLPKRAANAGEKAQGF